MFKINSEWDFGYGDTIFSTEEQAKQRVVNDPNFQQVAKEMNKTVNQLIQEGYISFNQLLLG